MAPDDIAQLTLAAYLVLALCGVWFVARRQPEGVLEWLLFVTARLYCGLAFQWRSNRRCTYPATGPALIIANHRSPVDPILLWMNNHLRGERTPFRVIGFLMAQEYYSRPGISWICRTMRSIPVARDGRDMKPVRDALRRLQSGDLIGLFPEGGIGSGNVLCIRNSGVAWLALRARVPVIPVFIHNAPQGRTMTSSFYTLARVRVSYGDPIDLSQFAEQPLSHEILAEATRVMAHELARLGGPDVRVELTFDTPPVRPHQADTDPSAASDDV